MRCLALLFACSFCLALGPPTLAAERLIFTKLEVGQKGPLPDYSDNPEAYYVEIDEILGEDTCVAHHVTPSTFGNPFLLKGVSVKKLADGSRIRDLHLSVFEITATQKVPSYGTLFVVQRVGPLERDAPRPAVPRLDPTDFVAGKEGRFSGDYSFRIREILDKNTLLISGVKVLSRKPERVAGFPLFVLKGPSTDKLAPDRPIELHGLYKVAAPEEYAPGKKAFVLELIRNLGPEPDPRKSK